MSYYDEYYCTKCGAILNDQPGFNTDLLIWRCTECGQELYGNILEKTMQKYKGIIWRCDSCEALLNTQDGFDDSCGIWYCTECGHANSINEDEILDYEDDSQDDSGEYICPYCGEVLDDQSDFDEDEEYWTCEECGTDLCKEYDEYNIIYRCPCCGDILDQQYSFFSYSEYHTCINCNTELIKDDNVYSFVYRCPNCDSVLNHQYSFDEDDECYTCQDCLTELYKNDDEYEFLYRCPECNDILNEQDSFDSDYDRYTCECCGTDLFKDDDVYRNVYKCPNCEDILLDQENFNSDLEIWMCQECQSVLYKQDDKYQILYLCPNCSTVLNKQNQFDEDNIWTCQICGKKIINNGTKYEIFKESNKAETYNFSEYDKILKFKNRKSNQTFRTPFSGMGAAVPKKIKPTTILLVTIALMAIMCIYEFSILISVQYSSNALIGKHYESVVDDFNKAGFSAIYTNEIRDLDIQEYSEEYKVTAIKIGWVSNFNPGEKYPSNFPITITYHTLKRIYVPMSSKEARSSKYEDVVKAFKDAGFINVEVNVKYDIYFGWFAEVGDVESVSIGDTKTFSADDMFKPNEKIIITYHDFADNKP